MTRPADARNWWLATSIGVLAASSVAACGAVSHSRTSTVRDAGPNDAALSTLPDGGDASVPDAGDSSAPCAWTERAILGANPPVVREGLGGAVAIDGRSFIVGASAYPTVPGSAYVYDENGATWVQVQRLSSGGTDLDSFGESIAVAGNWLVVGASTTGRNIPDTPDLGGVFFFARNGGSWSQPQFVAGKGLGGFGESVAMSSGLAAVGGTNPVAAFRQEGAAWIEDGMIAVPGDELTLVALSGDTLAVGVPDDGERGEHAGAVHVFRRQVAMATSYVHEAKLLGSNIGMYSQFGDSLSLDGDVLAVGGPSDATAYVFERAGDRWTQSIVLSSPHSTRQDGFGFALALDGTRLAVGAPRAFDAGTVHIYEKVGEAWEHRTELGASRPIIGLGASMALHGNLLVAGASTDSVGGMYTGSAVVWECVPPNDRAARGE